MKEQKNLKPYSKINGMRDYAKRIRDAMAEEGKQVSVFVVYRAIEGTSQNAYSLEIRQRFVDMLEAIRKRQRAIDSKISRL